MTDERETPPFSDSFADKEWLEAKEVFFLRNRPLLLERLLEQRNYFSKVLDCGTGIGSLIKHLVVPQSQLRTYYREDTAENAELYLDKPEEPLIRYDRVVGVDTEDDLLEVARKNLSQVLGVEFRNGDVLHLEFGDGEFDLVMSQEVLEHLSDPVGAIREMWRVLKPGGTLLCLRNNESEIILEPPFHGMPTLDTMIIRNFNKYILRRERSTSHPGSDSHCGRKLWSYAVKVPLPSFEITPTPWFIYPAPTLSLDEQRVLRWVVEFLYWASKDEGVEAAQNDQGLLEQDRIDSDLLNVWRSERMNQIERGELVFYVNLFSLMATK